MIDTVGSLGYGKKLGKYGFSERLCSNKEQCEEYLDFCKKNKMVWLGRSYGTLVHKKFSNHFDWLGGRHKESDIQIELKVMDDNYHFLVDLNHSNVIKSKVNGVHMITSSPNYINWNDIKNYPYSVFVIHPSLLEDYSLSGINLAFTNITFDEMAEINNKIYEDLGIYKAFRHLYGSYREDEK